MRERSRERERETERNIQLSRDFIPPRQDLAVLGTVRIVIKFSTGSCLYWRPNLGVTIINCR